MVSGADVDETITFAANGTRLLSITFMLTDDSVPNEPSEIYFLRLSNPRPLVNLGQEARITILDDDIGRLDSEND